MAHYIHHLLAPAAFAFHTSGELFVAQTGNIYLALCKEQFINQHSKHCPCGKWWGSPHSDTLLPTVPVSTEDGTVMTNRAHAAPSPLPPPPG